jgi:hypothetical protein
MRLRYLHAKSYQYSHSGRRSRYRHCCYDKNRQKLETQTIGMETIDANPRRAHPRRPRIIRIIGDQTDQTRHVTPLIKRPFGRFVGRREDRLQLVRLQMIPSFLDKFNNITPIMEAVCLC